MADGSCLCVLAVALTFFCVNTSPIDDVRLHIVLPETQMVKYKDEIYVRLYQTVYDSIGATQEQFPVQLTQKDIWQDVDGRVIIMPGVSPAGKSKTFWVGVGDFRNQLKFVSTYQKGGARNPLVRSFLVKYDTIRNILNQNYVTLEKFKAMHRSNIAINVDLYLPNQFGLTEWNVQELRRNTLANSLVTYTTVAVNPEMKKHWGNILDVKVLYDKIGLPSEDIPGIYSFVEGKKRSMFLEKIAQDLEELDKLYERGKQGGTVSVEVDNKINEYNVKYMNKETKSLQKEDLSKTKAWAKEAYTRKQMNDRYYSSEPLDSSLPKRSKLNKLEIPDISTDDMFRESPRNTNRLSDMPKLVSESRQFTEQLKQVQSFLTYGEAYSKKIKLLLNEDPRLRRWLHAMTSAEKLLQATVGVEFLKEVKMGFLYDKGGFTSEDVASFVRKTNEQVTDLIASDEHRQYFSDQMNKFTDDLLDRKKSIYHSEVILQLDKSPEVVKAINVLSDRYELAGKTIFHALYSDEIFISIKGSWSGIEMLDQTRITIIGQGQNVGKDLQVSNKGANTLANIISQNVVVNANDEITPVGKISIVACNTNTPETIAVESDVRFSETLLKHLESENIQTLVATHAGSIQVTEEGLELYGNAVESDYRNKEGKITSWNAEIPDKTKQLITLSYSGSFDIGDDMAVTRQSSVTYIDGEKRGPLSHIENNMNNEIVPHHYEDSGNLNNAAHVGDETGVQDAFVLLETEVWHKKLLSATDEVMQQLPDPKEWVPLIDTATEDSVGNTKLTLINLDTNEQISVKANNDAFIEFKKRTKRYGLSVKSLPKFGKTSIGMSGTGAVMGVAGFIYSVIQMTRSKQCKENVTCPTTENARKLAKALEINSYVGISQGSFGLVSDSIQITELIVGFKLNKQAVNGIVTMSKSTYKFLHFSKVVGSIGMGIGAVGSVVNLGFSAYQLAHAETKAQKVQSGIQVGIDSVGVAVTAVSIGATLTAMATSSALASSIAAVAGPVGFAVAIVGFLTSVITGLAFQFTNTRNQVGQVGEYFYLLDQAYRNHGYEYDYSTNTFRILNHAIVEMVDFETRVIRCDSQYIYRTKHGATGSGRSNYFFWYKDFPKMILNKAQAINIRCGIGYCSNEVTFHMTHVTNIILPVIPKSYISYEYYRLPFCTAMHDKGFDIIRRLEQDYRFDYDFYIVPSEYMVGAVTHEYVQTTVTVRLSKSVQFIIVPELPHKMLQFKYTYRIITSNTQHSIILHDGFTFILESTGPHPCTWFLDYKVVDFNEISFGHTPGAIYFGQTANRTRIEVTSRSDNIFIMDKDGGTLYVNPYQRSKELRTVVQRQNMTSHDLKRYLQSMNKNWLSQQKNIEIRNFTNGDRYIGKAYYVVDSGMMIYTDLHGIRISKEFKENVQLLDMLGDNAYFMGEEDDSIVIWRTNISTRAVEATYNFYCGNLGYRITKLPLQEHAVVLIQNVFNVSLIYMLYPWELKLVSIDGNEDSIYKLTETCFPSLNAFLPRYQPLQDNSNSIFPGVCIYATTIPILALKQTLADGENKHYWFYMNETEAPENISSGLFCAPSKPPVAAGIIRPNMTKECNDLTLRDIQPLPTGEEAYFFFCETVKQLFYQAGNVPARQVFVPGEIEMIQDFGPVKLVKSKRAGLYRFKETGDFSLAALSFDKINFQSNWKEVLKNISEQSLVETFIPILNLQTSDGNMLTAWYDSVYERLVIVSPSLDAKDIIFLGSSPSPFLVWLYSPAKQQIILQKVFDDESISNTIHRSKGKAIWNSTTKPSGKVILNDTSSVEYVDGRVFAITNEGIIVVVDHFCGMKLLGVNATWIASNGDHLAASINTLCDHYKESGVITLGHGNGDQGSIIHKWYQCGLRMKLRIEVTGQENPVYLGANTEKKSVFFFVGEDIIKLDSNNNILNRVKRGVSSSNAAGLIITKASRASVHGKTLLLHTSDSSSLNTIPKLDNLTTLVLATSNGSEIRLDADVWLHYETVYITSIGSVGPQVSYLNIYPPYHCSYSTEATGDDDSMIYDPISDRTIIFEDFTTRRVQLDSDGIPNGNEAVIRVKICDQEITFVTNRLRYDALRIQNQRRNGQDWLSVTSIAFSVGVLILIGLIWRAYKIRNRENDKLHEENPSSKVLHQKVENTETSL